jgi:hypothetical protein
VKRRDLMMSGAFAVGALAVAGAIVAILVARPGPHAAAPPAQALAVTLEISPRPALFGDPLTATARVLVDASRVDPGSVRVDADFDPYTPARASLRSSSRSGRVAAVEFRFLISCLTADCVPGAAGRRIRFPATLVRARQQDGRAVQVRAPWPILNLLPRVDEQALTASPRAWREQSALPPVSYRTRPGALLAVLLSFAAGLALAALALVAVELARRRQSHARAKAVSRLALALALARESMRRDPDDRRKALALLARVLSGENSGEERLAAAAEHLAWSRGRPEAERIDALAAEVEREVSRT